jgi:hypothetical protein
MASPVNDLPPEDEDHLEAKIAQLADVSAGRAEITNDAAAGVVRDYF